MTLQLLYISNLFTHLTNTLLNRNIYYLACLEVKKILFHPPRNITRLLVNFKYQTLQQQHFPLIKHPKEKKN